jgi:hypothetical protein
MDSRLCGNDESREFNGWVNKTGNMAIKLFLVDGFWETK